jgi:hypothetical protein
MPMVLAGLVDGAPLASAEVLNTHRIPALLALEAASESVGGAIEQFAIEQLMTAKSKEGLQQLFVQRAHNNRPKQGCKGRSH